MTEPSTSKREQEDVESHLKKLDVDVDAEIRRLEDTHQKYRMMESRMFAEKVRYKSKLPELKNSLSLLDVLESKQANNENLDVRFILSEQCYTAAAVAPTKKVCLWLGANVMLEYELEEARELLTKNMTAAEKGIDELNKELDFVKDQLTTTEVNLARVINFGVQRKKAAPLTAVEQTPVLS